MCFHFTTRYPCTLTRMSLMGIRCHPRMLIHGNLLCSCPWEPRSTSFFLDLELLAILYCWAFFQTHLYRLGGNVLCGLQVHAPRPCSICERDFENTLPPCHKPPHALISFFGSQFSLMRIKKIQKIIFKQSSTKLSP
jgi:hypothetical protein